MTNSELASDNDIIILPQNNSSVIALNKNGQIIWNNEISGDILSKIIIQKDRAFFLTQKAENLIYLNSISIETGLTVWQTEINKETQIEDIQLLFSKNPEQTSILVNKQLFHLIDSETGNIENTVKINSEVTSNISFYEDKLLFVNKQNQLIQLSLYKGKNNILQKLDNKTEKIHLTKKGQLLLSNDLGQLKLVEIGKKEEKWSFRAGGNISSISELKDNLIITSLDNYIYSLSSQKGKLLWKKRLEGRNEGVKAEIQNQFISSLINGQNTIFLEVKKGRAINQITLQGDSFFTVPPKLLDNLIILSTNRGLMAYSFGKC